MITLQSSQIVFLIGVIIMAISVISIVIAAILFTISGKRIKTELEEAYGKPWKYNITKRS